MTFLVVQVPLIYVFDLAVRQGLAVVGAVGGAAIDVTSIEALFDTAGYPVVLVSSYESKQKRIVSGIETATSSVLDLAGSLPGLFVGPGVCGGAKPFLDCLARTPTEYVGSERSVGAPVHGRNPSTVRKFTAASTATTAAPAVRRRSPTARVGTARCRG